MQNVQLRKMKFSIETEYTQIPEPADFIRLDSMDNMDKRIYLEELGVPESAISAMWYFCNGGSFYENSSVLGTFLETVLDYYAECSYEDAPLPYTEDWKDVRNEVLAKVINDELYGF